MGTEQKEEKEAERDLANQILTAIKSIRFGYVQVVIQDSKVVQIDVTEKIRVQKN